MNGKILKGDKQFIGCQLSTVVVIPVIVSRLSQQFRSQDCRDKVDN